MHSTGNESPQARLNLAAIVMLGVLAASVAAAWLTTRTQKANAYLGADIITRLSDDSISRYWTASPDQRWMIGLVRSVRPISWEMSRTESASPGVFSGRQVMGAMTVSYKSNWTLSSDLSHGRYVSRSLNANGQEESQTIITLTDDDVTVIRRTRRGELKASARRPDNYVPEGAFPLALKLVSDGRSRVTVKMIFDSQAVSGGKVNFVNVSLTPRGGNVVRVEGVESGLPPAADYTVDSDNQISSYAYVREKLLYRRCEKETVADLFGLSDDGPASRAAPEADGD